MNVSIMRVSNMGSSSDSWLLVCRSVDFRAQALSLAMVGALWLTPAIAFAEEAVDSSTRAAARQLGYEGVQLYQAEDYAAATDRLERAYKMLPVPSLALWSGRSLEKSGQWVEAAERYLQATRLPQDPGGDAEVQKKARSEAVQAREALVPRIPQLTVRVQGVESDRVELTLNGKKVASALIGSARPTNPGDIVVRARVGSQVQSRTVTLAEAQKEEVVLAFAPAAMTDDKPAGDPYSGEPRDGTRQSNWQRPVGWAAVGVGGAGLIFGAVSGILALGAQNDACVNGVCPPSVPDDALNSYNSYLTMTSIGFIAGGVLTASGVTLLLTAPKSHRTASVAPYLAGTAGGIRGTF